MDLPIAWITQIDLPDRRRSGLVHALKILEQVKGISVTRFTHEDVVRHPIVQNVLIAYERDEQQRKQAQRSDS